MVGDLINEATGEVIATGGGGGGRPYVKQEVKEDKAWYRNFIEGTNQAVAELLGGVGEIMNVAVRAMNFEPYFADAEAWTNLFESVGIHARPDPGPMGAAGRSVTGGLIFLTGLGYAARTAPLVRAIPRGGVAGMFDPMVQAGINAPLKTLVADIGISIPAGVAGYYGGDIGREAGRMVGSVAGEMVDARQEGGDIGARYGGQIGEMAGEVGIPLILGGIYQAGAASVRKVNQEFGISQAGREKEVAKMLRRESYYMREDVMTTAEDEFFRMQDPEFGLPGTGELMNDPGLISYHRALARKTTSGAARSTEMAALRGESLRKGFPKVKGRKEDAVGFFQRRLEQSVNRVEAAVSRAKQRAQDRISKLSYEEPMSEISKIVKQEFGIALKQARLEEKKIWREIGSNELVTTKISDRAVEIVLAVRQSGNKNDVHPLIWRLAREAEEMPDGIFDEYGTLVKVDDIEGIPTIEPIDDIYNIQELRSQFLDAIRQENSRGNWKRGRHLKSMVDEMTNDLQVPEGSDPSVIARWEKARDYSRSFNKTFFHDESPLSKVLGYSRTGGNMVAPELTLEVMIQSGTPGLLAIRAARDAASYVDGGLEKMDGLISGYLRAKFSANTIDDTTGAFNQNRAKTFINRHSELLNEFPNLKSDMMNAAKAEQIAMSTDKSGRNRINRIKTKSIAAIYTRGNVDQQMGSIGGAQNPRKKARILKNMAAKDPSGRATRGLQAGFYEYLMSQVAPDSRNFLDLSGNTVVQAGRLRKFLHHYGGVIDEIYGPHALKLLKEVSEGANIGERIRLGMAAGGGSDTAQNLYKRLRSKLGSVAAIIGSNFGLGHGLVVAGQARQAAVSEFDRVVSTESNRLLALMEDALYDPEKARMLLRKFKPRPEKEMSATKAGLLASIGGAAAYTDQPEERF